VEASSLGKFVTEYGLRLEGEVKLNAKCWSRILERREGVPATGLSLNATHRPASLSAPLTALLICSSVTVIQWVTFLEKSLLQGRPLQVYYFGMNSFPLTLPWYFLTTK